MCKGSVNETRENCLKFEVFVKLLSLSIAMRECRAYFVRVYLVVAPRTSS